VSTPYFILVREMSSAYNHRLRLVAHARQDDIKPTARLFQTTVPTVRKWLRRYQQHDPRGLIELSRAPHHQPGKTPPEIEQWVVALRQQLPTFGARRLIREFDLPLSHRALERIWRAHGSPSPLFSGFTTFPQSLRFILFMSLFELLVPATESNSYE